MILNHYYFSYISPLVQKQEAANESVKKTETKKAQTRKFTEIGEQWLMNWRDRNSPVAWKSVIEMNSDFGLTWSWSKLIFPEVI